MKSLQKRQQVIERLFERHPPVPSEVKPVNSIYDFSAREVIKADPYIYKVWQSRTLIVKDQPEVKVPANTVAFFQEYAKGIKSPSQVIEDAEFEYKDVPFEAPTRHTCVMYSGGSESVLLDATYSYVDLIRINHFFPNTSITREFQLALIGMALGYNTTLVGCGFVPQPKVRREFEYSEDFVDMWNETFYPFTLQYPFGWSPSKDVILEYLGRNNFPFISCETVKTPEGCGRCWHCAEKYFFTMAIKTRPGYDHVELPKMDLDFLKQVQRQNAWNMKQEVDKFAVTTDLFRMLETYYGVTAWYKGDPTKPFDTSGKQQSTSC